MQIMQSGAEATLEWLKEKDKRIYNLAKLQDKNILMVGKLLLMKQTV